MAWARFRAGTGESITMPAVLYGKGQRGAAGDSTSQEEWGVGEKHAYRPLLQ